MIWPSRPPQGNPMVWQSLSRDLAAGSSSVYFQRRDAPGPTNLKRTVGPCPMANLSAYPFGAHGFPSMGRLPKVWARLRFRNTHSQEDLEAHARTRSACPSRVTACRAKSHDGKSSPRSQQMWGLIRRLFAPDEGQVAIFLP